VYGFESGNSLFAYVRVRLRTTSLPSYLRIAKSLWAMEYEVFMIHDVSFTGLFLTMCCTPNEGCGKEKGENKSGLKSVKN